MEATIERAILCANGRVHFAHEYLEHDDPERVREIADKQCGGAPHVIASRKRIVTDWEPS